jgi:hypothetical protein
MNLAPKRRSCLYQLVALPTGCLFSFSPFLLLALAFLVVISGAVVYLQVNFDPLGWFAPDYSNLAFNANFTTLNAKDKTHWVITYEKSSDSVFTGLVRHVSPIRMNSFPFLTHDVLVTSGQFADSSLVSTSVFNHHFSWTSSLSHPAGSINLLHVVPVNRAVYQILVGISSGQQVILRGMEIQRIDAYTPNGSLSSYWQDDGCNSILVTSVEIK